MALSLRVTWEVRSTGNTSNSGGFDPSVASLGTDFSQQAAAQFIRTDLVIGAANSLTSAAQPFSAAEVGNVIRILSGVNFSAGFYTIISMAGAVATLDRSPGTLAATGGTGRVGGALSSPNDTPAIAGGTVWLQGSFTISGQWVLNAGVGDGNFAVYAGYTTVRGDNGLATVTASANLSPMLTQADQLILRNLKVSGAANTADRGVDLGASCYVENVWVTGCNLSGMRAQNSGTRIQRCLFTSNGAGAAGGVGLDVGTGSLARACEASGNKQGFSSSNGAGNFEQCVSHGNTAAGFYQAGVNGLRLRNCTADANTGNGLTINDTSGILTMAVTNCLFTNNGAFGISSVTTDYTGVTTAAVAAFFQNNGFFNNTSGSYHQVPAGAADLVLTATPYTNAAGGDYSLNGTAGGGPSVLGQGLPGGIGLFGAAALGSTGHMDLGAVQTLGAGVVSTATQTMMSLWREITNERFTAGDATSAVPDATVQIYLDWGLQALNREAHYHWTDGTITLVAGQQEYAVPADFVIAQFLQFANYRRLERSSVETWMLDNADWRNETGEPRFWALYSNKVVLRPTPTAEAVAASPTLTLRYCSTPPAIAGAGPEQLGSQEHRLVVLYGALLWSMVFPESLVAQQRISELQKQWDSSLPRVVQDYAARNIST